MTIAKKLLVAFGGLSLGLELFFILRRIANRQRGPFPIPWVRPFLAMRDVAHIHHRQINFHKTYGQSVTFVCFLYCNHLISDLEGMKFVLKETALFPNRSNNPFMAYFSPYGLLSLLTDETWKRHRSVLSQMFTDSYLEHYTTTMQRITTRVLDRWESNGEVADLGSDLAALTLDVLGNCVMGYDFRSTEPNSNCILSKKKVSAMLKYLVVLSPLPKWLKPWVPLFRLKREAYQFQSELKSLIRSLIARTDVDDRCLLKMLTNPELGWSEEELMSEINDFMLAGHETTANALTFALHLLSFHPLAQQKAVEEIHRVCGDCTAITLKELNSLRYVWAIFREALRMYPIVRGTARTVAKTTTLPSGLTVNTGDLIIVNWAMLSYDEQYFKNAHQFEPERWLSDEARSEAFDIVMNFGGGARKCIGQRFAEEESVLILAMILSRVEVLPKNQTKADIETVFSLTISPAETISLKFKPRKIS